MRPTHLADTSAWGQLHRPDVAARVVSLLVGGAAATCGIVDLEVIGSFADPAERAEVRRERRALPQVAVDDDVLDRAAEVLLRLPGSPVALASLVVAAAAERAGVVVLHHDDAFDRIAAVTGQPTEWVDGRDVRPPGQGASSSTTA